jgi:4-alpha-glucanotransferase
MPPKIKKTTSSSPSILADRRSGVLLHPTSLPGPYGIGDLGPEAEKFLSFLADAKQRFWMMLPTSPTSEPDFHSPYSSYSAFAGNPLLISPDLLFESGLCTRADTAQLKKCSPTKNPNRADLRRAAREKEHFLREVFGKLPAKSKVDRELERFSAEHRWLEDFALFTSIRKSQKKPRSQWSLDLRVKDKRRAPALMKAHEEAIRFEVFCQWLFFSQFNRLKGLATEKGVAIVGDLPIYVSDDSADVWASPHYFALDKEKRPTQVSGCPPDAFATTGQLWGHPIYNWKALERDNFSWWVDRMRTTLQLADIVRIDHFRGLAAYYAIPYGDPTAEHGKWQKCPGDGLLTAFQDAFGSVPVIAEDLGFITDDVHELRDKFELYGMRLLQFGFEGDEFAKNIHAPFNIPPNSVAFTGSHDKDTAAGWFRSLTSPEKKHLLSFLDHPPVSNIAREFVRLTLETPAKLAIIPLQDILSLGSSARMNRPGFARWDNWSWRFDCSLKEAGRWLGEVTVATGRAG